MVVTDFSLDNSCRRYILYVNKCSGSESMVYQPVGESILVYALFKKGKIQPLSFKWGQKVYKVAKVTGQWRIPAGKYKLHHFGVLDTQDNFYQLCYSEEDFSWTIIQTWNEG